MRISYCYHAQFGSIDYVQFSIINSCLFCILTFHFSNLLKMLKLEKHHSDKETDSNGNYEVSIIVNMSALRLLS